MSKLIKILIIVFIIIFLFFQIFNVKIANVTIYGNTKQEDSKLLSEILENEICSRSIVLFIKDKCIKHKDIPFVESYTIKWITPFTIEIDVKEKDPIGFVKKDIKNVYFDDSGTVIDVSSDRKASIPEVVGLNFKNFVKGEKLSINDKDMLDSILIIAKKCKDEKLPIDLIEIDRSSNISVYLGNITVAFGQNKNIDVKLKRLKEIYPEIKEYKGILDLSDAKENMIDEQYIFKKTS